MSQITAVSFDADAIRVLTARRSGKNLTIENALTLDVAELDPFLASDHSSEYLVITNFVDAIYETIVIPPVEPRLVEQLINAEIRRLHPDLPPFTSGWKVIADIAQEGKTIRKVACCLVDNEIIAPVLEPFIRHNKPVRQLISLPNALAKMVTAATPEATPTLLCAHDDGTRKTIFVLEEGAVTFVRHVSSDGPGWNEFDLQHISMTLDYCFQTLRVRPSKSIALNAESVGAPLNRFEPPPDLPGDESIQIRYQHLLSALTYTTPGSEGLLPEVYSGELKQQDVLNLGIRVFSAIILLLLIPALYFTYSIASLNKDIAASRMKEKNLKTVLAAYNATMQEKAKIEPLAAALAAKSATPSIPALLTMLPEPPPLPASVNSLNIKKEKDLISIQLSGSIHEPQYAVAQDIFEQYSKKVTAIGGITVTAKKFDSKDQKFSIDSGYKP